MDDQSQEDINNTFEDHYRRAAQMQREYGDAHMLDVLTRNISQPKVGNTYPGSKQPMAKKKAHRRAKSKMQRRSRKINQQR